MNPSENYMNQMPLPNSRSQKTGIGAIIAVIIIIALLAFGGWYFWNEVQQQRQDDDNRVINSELESTSTDAINAELEADLQTMQEDDLGESDMESVDQEFSQ